MAISDYSLRRPVTILVALAAVLVLGAISITRLKLDFLPKVDWPFVGVQLPYPNAVPAQVEREIARPVEEVLATLGDVKSLRSYSDRDGAFVGVEFDFGRDIDVLRLEVKERLEQVRPLLPADLEDYFIFTFNTTDIPVMEGRISAPGRDLAGSYELLERRIIAPLQRIEGVGRVVVDGVSPKDVTIYLLLDQIVAHGVDVGRLFGTLNASNMDLSLGRVQDGRQRVSVRSLGQFRSVEEIRELPIGPGIRLADVAEVVYAEPAPTYYRHIDGEPAIAFEIRKASGANIVEVSRRVHAELERFKTDPTLAGIDVMVWFDQGENIQGSLKDLLMSGLIGSLLAVGILLVFLRRLLTTLVAAIAIPVSVIATCAFLYLSHRSLNILTMMGLMLAVGMLVDNAIVVLEAIYRRHEKGEAQREAAAAGTREVAMAVVASTATSVIVFAPIVLTKNTEITLWLSEVGLTISVTLIISLLICLTVVPLLVARLRKTEGRAEFAALAWLRRQYLRLLGWTALSHRRATLAILAGLVVLTVGVAKLTNFKPSDMDDGGGVKRDHVSFWVEYTDNTNLYRVEEYVKAVEDFLIPRKADYGVDAVYTFYDDNFSAFRLFFPQGTEPSEPQISALRDSLRAQLPVLPGLKYRFRDNEDVGQGAQLVSVTLFGEDTDLLGEIAAEVVRRLGLIEGLHDVDTNRESGRDEVRVVLDRELAGRYGVSPRALSDVLGLTFRGVPLRKFQGAEREIDLGIVLEPSDRRNLENLARLPVSVQNGRPVLLGQVARFELGRGPTQIARERQQTAITVSGAYEGKEFDTAMERVRGVMNSLALPAGYSWSEGERLRRVEEQQNDMQLNILLALACVYIVMAVLFESLLHPLVIMLCIPFAVLGVIWTLILSRTPFNLFAMIGMVILVGIVVNNGIVLMDRIGQLRRQGLTREAAILEGCRDRFRPILMTAGTTVLGLMPLALGKATVAGGYYFPLARAVMGGLTASTLLTLIVLPTLMIVAEDLAARARATWAWGQGKAPLPWRRPAAIAGGGGEPDLATRTRRS